MVNIAILGYGTIGSGVAQLMEENSKTIAKKCGEEIFLKKVLDLRDFEGHSIQSKITHDLKDILEDPDIKIVVETMGGVEPASSFTEQCLLAGKSVVTSNKAVVAENGAKLLKIARQKQCQYLFEASVGGGIPIIRPMEYCMTGEQILEITGILNGTTNYILTKMDKEGISFEKALKEAQERGYAERNPEADIEGYDTCRKISILTSVATGQTISYKEIQTEGIKEITIQDFVYANKMDASIKLLARSRLSDAGVRIMVSPVMISSEHPLFGVNDVYNGILVKGNMVGDLMFYGSGAGKRQTASAVMADIVEAARFPGESMERGWEESPLTIENNSEMTHQYFMRISGNTLEKRQEAEKIFGEVLFTIFEYLDEFGILTKEMTEAEYYEKSKQMPGIIQMIRAEF